MSAKTTDKMLAALGWLLIDEGTAENKRSTPEAVDKTGAIRISDRWPSKGAQPFYTIFEVDGEFPDFASAVNAAYNAHKQASRRELTAKKLADLGWEECAFSGERAVESPDGMQIVPGMLDGWLVAGHGKNYADFDAAVDAAHAAKFPERQPLDEATFGRLLEEGQRDMKAFEAERRTGFPRKSEGRTADLNEPITMQDEDTPKPVRNPRVKVRIGLFYDVKTVADIEKMLRDGRALPSDRLWIFGKDAGSLEETRPQWAELLADDANHDADGGHCQTSELDLARAEVEQLKAALKEQEQLKLHWIDNAQRWEKLASNQANQIAKPKEAADHSTCERIFESLRAALAARNQDYESLKDAHRGLLNRQPVATFDGKDWTVEIGGLRVLIAWLSSDTVAEIDGWGKPAEEPEPFRGRDRADTIALVNALLAFRGIRVQE